MPPGQATEGLEAARVIKLDLPESGTDHRRVLAVLRFLEAR
jgi:hypothetical protein